MGYECARNGSKPSCLVTLIRISSCLSHCERVFVRTFTGGESWVNLLLSFCSPFSLFPSFTPPRSEKPQCTSECQWLSAYMFVSRVFFFSCLSAVKNAPILLYCSLIQVTWSRWKHQPADFKGRLRGFWIPCTSDSTVWKLVDGGNTNIGPLEPRWHQSRCSYVHFLKSFCSGLRVLGAWSWQESNPYYENYILGVLHLCYRTFFLPSSK